MKHTSALAIAVVAALMFTGTAMAGTYTFTPSPADIYDLDHYQAYRWGVEFDVPDNESIIGASLSFNNIYNNTPGGSDLWVTLLPNGTPGVINVYRDDQFPSNYFAGWTGAVELVHYQDLPYSPVDLYYSFSASELAALSNYLAADNIIGLGFDPDCHLKNDGVKFIIKTKTNETPVPEPATLILLCTGLVGIVGFRRMRRK